jgi:hypothetical protein
MEDGCRKQGAGVTNPLDLRHLHSHLGRFPIVRHQLKGLDNTRALPNIQF